MYGCGRCSDCAGWRIQGNWSTPLPDRPTSPKLLTSLLQLACGRDRPAQRHFYHSDISLFGSVHTGCVAATRGTARCRFRCKRTFTDADHKSVFFCTSADYNTVLRPSLSSVNVPSVKICTHHSLDLSTAVRQRHLKDSSQKLTECADRCRSVG